MYRGFVIVLSIYQLDYFKQDPIRNISTRISLNRSLKETRRERIAPRSMFLLLLGPDGLRLPLLSRFRENYPGNHSCLQSIPQNPGSCRQRILLTFSCEIEIFRGKILLYFLSKTKHFPIHYLFHLHILYNLLWFISYLFFFI